MKLSFLLIAHNDAETIWPVCQRLRQTTVAGDQIVVIDAGSADETPMLLRRFDQERGWGENVPAELILSPDTPDRGLADLQRLGHSRALGDWVIELGGDEYVQPHGVASLRDLLDVKDIDQIIAPRGRWLAGPDGALPLPDASRWPSEKSISLHDECARTAASKLAADPGRLVFRRGHPTPNPGSNLAARWECYDLAVSRASGIGFCPHPILLAPVSPGSSPSNRASEAALLAANRIREAPRTLEEGPLSQLLDRIGDEMALLAPTEAPALLDSLETLRKTLPRRLRAAAFAHPSPASRGLAALASGGRPAANVEIMMLLATRDRIHIDALAGEVRRLRADLDAALPGPEYLAQLYERMRRI